MTKGTLGTVVAMMGSLCVLPSCGRPDGSEIRQVARAQVQGFTVNLPGTAVLGEHALVANGYLQIGDRVTVVAPDGEPAAVANAGANYTRIGVQARTGDVLSVASLDLRNNALVDGDATTSGSIASEQNAQVMGAWQPFAAGLTPTIPQTVTVDFSGTNQGDVNVEPPNSQQEGSRSLAPGHYGRVTVKSNNRLELQTGTYYFDELQLEPSTRIVVDDGAGPVLINVRSKVQYKGRIESVMGTHPAVRVLYVGTQAVVLESQFDGAFLAPVADLRLATAHPSRRHVGVFFAKNLEVSPDGTIEFRPYWSYEAAPVFHHSGEPGRLGESVVTDVGEILSNSITNLVRYTPAGLAVNEFAEDARRKMVLGNGPTGFGHFTETTFERYRPDGTFVASLPAPNAAVARLVPGTLSTVIFAGVDEQRQDALTGFKVYAGSTVSEVSTPGALDLAVGQEHVVYTTGKETVCVTFDGTELWRSTFDLLDFQIAEAAPQLIGAYSDNGPQLVHIDLPTGSVIGPVALGSAPWAVEISPDGSKSLVAEKGRISVFVAGAPQRQIVLPMERFASADILNSGEIVVGGATPSKQSQLLLMGPEPGMGTWLSIPGPVDRGAFRPFVEFQGDSTDFIAVRKDGLVGFNVTRSL